MLLEIRGEITPKIMKTQSQHPVVNVTGDRRKVRCSKGQYFIETWNVRSMNQGKLEGVKQDMARVNIDILGSCELKWTAMSEFNSDDHYIYYCGQESLRNHHRQQKSLKCSSVWFSSVVHSCPTLWDAMNHISPGCSIYHQLVEPTQTHVI